MSDAISSRPAFGSLTALIDAYGKREQERLLALKARLTSENPGIPIIAHPDMPAGYFELRSGTQRVGCWLGGTADHDPGDEDRSER